jgi:hypothetical protein
VVDLVQLLIPSASLVKVPLVLSETRTVLGTASALIVVELLARVVVPGTVLLTEVP